MLPIFESMDGKSRIYINYGEDENEFLILYYSDIDDEYNFETLSYYTDETDEKWLDIACKYNNLEPKFFVKIGESDF